MDFEKSQLYISENREKTIELLGDFIATDLLIFWSDDRDVFSRQQKIWQPLLEIFQDAAGFEIKITQCLQAPNNEKCAVFVKNKLQQLSDKRLTACFLTAIKVKSVILGLMMLEEQVSADEIFEAAFLEELYQNELWGAEEEALNSREIIRSELKQIKECLQK